MLKKFQKNYKKALNLIILNILRNDCQDSDLYLFLVNSQNGLAYINFMNNHASFF
jgi:hypothetical protein